MPVNLIRLIWIALLAAFSMAVGAQSCPTNLGYLESKLPRYNLPELEQVRTAILGEDLTEAMGRMRSAGLSPAQMAATTLRMAQQAEEQTRVAEQCVRSTSSDPDRVLDQLRNGSYRFSGNGGVMESCLAQYVNMYYAQVAHKEIAVAVACLANR
jgi:N-acetylglucosamine kinase-like BadF-type ATPase